MQNISAGCLSGVPATLFFPLYARAEETRRSDAIIKDPYALDMQADLDFDFSIFERMPEKRSFRKTDMLTGIAVRTKLIDDATGTFLAEHPEGLVVNLGSGLDARSLRLDNGRALWIDVDLPEVVDLRSRLLGETERHQMIGASLLEEHWIKEIKQGLAPHQHVLILAEGTLMYFETEQVQTFFRRVADHFPGARLCFEVMGSARQGRVHPTVECLGVDVVCPWGIDDYALLETWDSRLQLIEAQLFIDYYQDRWSWLPRLLSRLFPRSKEKFGHAILQVAVQVRSDRSV